MHLLAPGAGSLLFRVWVNLVSVVWRRAEKRLDLQWFDVVPPEQV